MADDLASGGYVMSTKMADKLISADSVALNLTLKSDSKQMTLYVYKDGGRLCLRRSRDVNTHGG